MGRGDPVEQGYAEIFRRESSHNITEMCSNLIGGELLFPVLLAANDNLVFEILLLLPA